MDAVIGWIGNHKEPLTVLLSACALVVSISALVRPWLKDWRENRNSVFQALQGDRKAIALVTLRVLNREWDTRLNTDGRFRKRLLQSLAIAAGLESSDRGKAYVLAAINHIVRLGGSAQDEAMNELRKVESIFTAYAKSGADPRFKGDRLVPLQAIINAVEAKPNNPLEPIAPKNGAPAER